MKLKRVEIVLCEACLSGEREECHTPGCALSMHDSPGCPIMPEMYEVLSEWEVGTEEEGGMTREDWLRITDKCVISPFKTHISTPECAF